MLEQKRHSSKMMENFGFRMGRFLGLQVKFATQCKNIDKVTIKEDITRP